MRHRCVRNAARHRFSFQLEGVTRRQSFLFAIGGMAAGARGGGGSYSRPLLGAAVRYGAVTIAWISLLTEVDLTRAYPII
jgi:hypothetical protein